MDEMIFTDEVYKLMQDEYEALNLSARLKNGKPPFTLIKNEAVNTSTNSMQNEADNDPVSEVFNHADTVTVSEIFNHADTVTVSEVSEQEESGNYILKLIAEIYSINQEIFDKLHTIYGSNPSANTLINLKKDNISRLKLLYQKYGGGDMPPIQCIEHLRGVNWREGQWVSYEHCSKLYENLLDPLALIILINESTSLSLTR